MRIKQLDALRAIALFLVIGHHTHWIPVWSRIGWSGVDLFFVLSGFLISGLLFREYKISGSIRIGHFLARRALKIYPAYYVFLSSTVLIAIIVGAPFGWDRIWPDLVFVQNYKVGTWGHLWSVAVEEHFYLILPISLWLEAKRKSDNPFGMLPLVVGLIAATCLTLRCIPWWTGQPYSFLADSTPSHLRFDGLAFGVLLSYLWEFRPGFISGLVRNRGRWLLGVSALLISPEFVFPLEHPFMHTVGFTCSFIAYGGLLIYCMKCLNGDNPVLTVLAKIGIYSYTIYLVHLPVAFWCVSHGWSSTGFHKTLVFCVYLPMSIAVGILFGKAVELPVLRLREKILPRIDLDGLIVAPVRSPA